MPELRPLDSTQPECLKCGLFIHQASNEIPDDGELAWRLYTDLNSPVVQRFNLQAKVLECHDLDMTPEEFLDLVYLMNAIADGVEEWFEENPSKHGT